MSGAGHAPPPGAEETALARFLGEHPASILVKLAQVQGSAPREAGTWMLEIGRAHV